ncbi:isomerase [Staphylococcus gallinarum]|uniref:sugar phosphate isomerase/epimerase family protein n=1 Tax=Staphylococcus TaxID=1279 RepID=UPI000D1D59F8|nr:sugar phosphate isomerase/epimerase [Staphylococcus gallinarum]MCD8820664.1 sugar phosphate isomerase/epimerase [Staphylococcus gallinarum]PTL09744.1 isomerase [Staphylococcus gallinarum]PTL12711.1 isomerase [Staphylococcus gallinarum]RIL35375.1 sugar phosphate isomerase/epimerase [Staphylococcus gallinarum]RIO77492.1 sugar phosphate isomerase/epimerase [Staphylococcus gallinarum]
MKLGYNVATTKENATLQQELELCDKHGYDFIEIQMDKMPEYLETHTLEDMKAFFDTHHIKPLSLNALQFFNNRNDADYRAVLDEFKEWLEIAHYLGAKYIVLVPLVTETKILNKAIHDSCVKVMTEFATLAEAYHIKIALEFLGAPYATVNTFQQAYDIVEDVAKPNVGLVLDFFHFHAMGSNLADLRKAKAENIFLLHINDVDDYPIGILTDEDRCFPGRGVIDIKGIFNTLREIGFQGEFISIELFRPEYYRLPAEDVIVKSKETVKESVQPFYPI